MDKPDNLFRCLSCGSLWQQSEIHKVPDQYLKMRPVCGNPVCWGNVIRVPDEKPLHPLIGRYEELNLWQSFQRRQGFIRVGYYHIEPDGHKQLVLFLPLRHS